MARYWFWLLLALAALLFAAAWPRQTARAEKLSFASPAQAPAAGERVRIQTDLARRVEVWHGKGDCRSPGRARAALTPVLSRWLGARITERPARQLTRWGYHSGDIWHEDRLIDGQPQCSGGFRKIIAYADFR